MKLLGVDISMSNTGLALVELDVDNLRFEILGLYMIYTIKSKEKIRKNTDDLNRARELYSGIEMVAQKADIMVVEMPHGSQSARAMASYGMCVGVLSSFEMPLVQMTNVEVKRAATGDKNASKQEVIDWAVKEHPDADWMTTKSGRILLKNEHCADAVAAIQASLITDQLQGALSLLK